MVLQTSFRGAGTASGVLVGAAVVGEALGAAPVEGEANGAVHADELVDPAGEVQPAVQAVQEAAPLGE